MTKICREAIFIRYITKTGHVLLVFFFGAFIYGFLEILWRGYTHPSMLVLGGICFSLIFILEEQISHINIFSRCLLYALIISALEFVFGIVLNMWLRLNVWDYSDIPLNLLGQICLPFTALWYLLSLVSCKVCEAIRFVFGQ